MRKRRESFSGCSTANIELEGCRQDGDYTSLSLLDLNIRINRAGEAAFDFESGAESL